MAVWDRLKGYWELKGNALDKTKNNNGFVYGGAPELIWLKLNGDAQDSSPSDKDGDWTGTEDYGEGLQYLQAARFDGVSPVGIDVPGVEDMINGLSEFGMSIWVKSNVINTDNGFIIANNPSGHDDPFGIRFDKVGASGGGSNVIKFGMEVTNGVYYYIESAENVQTTDWLHIYVDWKSGEHGRMFLNGVETAYTDRHQEDNTTTEEIPTDPVTGVIQNCKNFILGRGGKDINENWDGLVTDFRLYSQRLDSTEIAELYNSGAGFVNSTGWFEDDAKLGNVAVTDQNKYIEVSDADNLSVDTSKGFSMMILVRPDVLNFPYSIDNKDYLHFCGKGEPDKHEWGWRIYDKDGESNRPNRMSFYLWNNSGGLGAGSYVQDEIEAGEWIMLLVTVDNEKIRLYKNGVKRDEDLYYVDPYWIIPQNSTAPMRIGTKQLDGFFSGGIARVAIWDRTLSDDDAVDLYDNGNFLNYEVPVSNPNNNAILIMGGGM